MNANRWFACVATAVGGLFIAGLATTMTPVAAAAPEGAPAARQAGGGYARQTTCLSCPEDRAYAGTAHSRAFNERTPAAAQGCESCHGPGRAHAESGDAALIRR